MSDKEGTEAISRLIMAPKSRATQMAENIRTKMQDAEVIQIIGNAGVTRYKVVSTGSLGLDLAVGVGGFPHGRIVEVYGPESSGKSTLALHVVANAQRCGGVATYVDAEHALDLSYAKNLGVNADELLLSQPSSGEEALSIVEHVVGQGQAGDVVVVDSVAALVPQAEIDGAMGDMHMGLQARMMGQALRKITSLSSSHGVIVVFINQIRQKLGVVFGSNETTTGGNALKYYATMRLDIRRISQNKVGDEVVSNRTRVKVVKNKVAPPFKQVEFDIKFGTGVDFRAEILDLGVKHGLLEQSGSWYSYKQEKLANGREATIKVLLERPDLEQILISGVRAAMFGGLGGEA